MSNINAPFEVTPSEVEARAIGAELLAELSVACQAHRCYGDSGHLESLSTRWTALVRHPGSFREAGEREISHQWMLEIAEVVQPIMTRVNLLAAGQRALSAEVMKYLG